MQQLLLILFGIALSCHCIFFIESESHILHVIRPTSDGSAAAILASEDFVRKHKLEKQAVEIIGQQMVTDFPSTFTSKSAMELVGYGMTKTAAERLYKQTGEMIDVF